MKRLRRAVLACAFAVCGTAAAETEPSILSGVVIDAATSVAVPAAVVVARSPTLPGEQRAVTDATGAFEITLLPAGTYSLAVTREGFEPFSPAGLVVKGGRVRIRIALVPLP